MGISQLLPLLKSIQQPVHLSDLSGCCVAIDAYVWLHKGAFGCATEIGLNKPTDRFVQYCMQFVNLMKHHNIKPLLVFDGGPLPSKQYTEDDRYAKREKAQAQALQLYHRGSRREATELFQRCVDITPELALQLIERLRREKVDYIVAPYEADAQLYYLEKIGLVDAVITEDSDLLVFGCQRVIFKLDQQGNGVEIRRANFRHVQGLQMAQWSDQTFRHMCILSGCDYLPSIPRIGLKTAYQLLKKHVTAERVLQTLRLEGKYQVPPGYEAEFQRADRTFLHQRVFDPFDRVVKPLNPIPNGLDEQGLHFIGA
ncbi:PIN domain-like protein [Dimargaris cristalligena]|uniref:Exonuclease 1 n=1 Tax=Dimargaris cristalligena TaxID=215637 RepID=A0A4P9ZMN5_9FUNG|nr:PIN domain-like protein [Dimargaris cristalligena]|eukprot:RKP34385.1 PIN domain-like protein [Dimargaris cristalligena]